MNTKVKLSHWPCGLIRDDNSSRLFSDTKVVEVVVQIIRAELGLLWVGASARTPSLRP